MLYTLSFSFCVIDDTVGVSKYPVNFSKKKEMLMDRKWFTMRCIVCPMHAEVFWYVEAMYFTVPEPKKQ
jgi:hypothetical protein